MAAKKPAAKKPVSRKNKPTIAGAFHDIGLLFAGIKEIQREIRNINQRADSAKLILDRVDDTATALERRVFSDEKAKPAEYILTDADWQRVIDEGYLCEFSDAFPTFEVYIPNIAPLKSYKRGCYLPALYTGNGRPYTYCRPLNKPGVMQPYFGQGMPVSPDAKVVMQWNDGWVGHGKAAGTEKFWTRNHDGRRIVAFMILS